MDKNRSSLLDKSIELELNIAHLYRGFSHTCAQDKEFWLWLTQEEQNHAALLNSAKLDFVDAGYFPPEMLSISLNALIKANQEVLGALNQNKQKTLLRTSAFKVALRIEASARELDFDRAMEKKADSAALKRGARAHTRCQTPAT